MTARSLCSCMALLLLATATVAAQTAPICPSSPYIRILRFPNEFGVGGVPISDHRVELLIQQVVSTTEYWNFKFEGAVVVDNVISGSAPGIRAPPPGFPPGPVQAGLFGPVPAGDYTIIVQPIATNVTPNVNCPLLTIPLTVLQGNQAVPVPAPTGALAALLASLLACIAIVVLRLRRRANASLR